MINELALTFDFIGKFLIGISVLLVHHKIFQDGRIDKLVLKEMKKEYSVAIIGLVFLTAGYIMHLFLL